MKWMREVKPDLTACRHRERTHRSVDISAFKGREHILEVHLTQGVRSFELVCCMSPQFHGRAGPASIGSLADERGRLDGRNHQWLGPQGHLQAQQDKSYEVRREVTPYVFRSVRVCR